MIEKKPRKKPDRNTRERILETALSLFRKRGFDETTMRDIASEANVALGAAYYYFRSKDEIVHAYYQGLNQEHARRVRAVLASEIDPRKRLGAMFHTSIELLKRDRKIISGLFRSVGEVSELSPFGKSTAPLRARSVALFEEALEPLALPDDTRRLTATALWGAHMAMILYLLHDDSKGLERTRKLVDGMLDLLVPLFPALPMLAPSLGDLSQVLRDAGLVARASISS